MKIDGKPVRAICLKADNGISVDDDGFVTINQQLDLYFD